MPEFLTAVLVAVAATLLERLVVHLARTVCRRAERRVVALAAAEPVSPTVVQYLNRLSDLLFVLARSANHAAGQPDQPWQQ